MRCGQATKAQQQLPRNLPYISLHLPASPCCGQATKAQQLLAAALGKALEASGAPEPEPPGNGRASA